MQEPQSSGRKHGLYMVCFGTRRVGRSSSALCTVHRAPLSPSATSKRGPKGTLLVAHDTSERAARNGCPLCSCVLPHRRSFCTPPASHCCQTGVGEARARRRSCSSARSWHCRSTNRRHLWYFEMHADGRQARSSCFCIHHHRRRRFVRREPKGASFRQLSSKRGVLSKRGFARVLALEALGRAKGEIMPRNAKACRRWPRSSFA